MDLHASGIEKMLEVVHESGAGGPIFEAYAADDLVSGLLILHDLHPLDLEQRVRRALEQPNFKGRGVTVELLSVREGVVHIRIEGGPSLKSAVEKAVWNAAPDAAEVMVEGAPGHQSIAGFVPLEQLLAG